MNWLRHQQSVAAAAAAAQLVIVLCGWMALSDSLGIHEDISGRGHGLDEEVLE